LALRAVAFRALDVFALFVAERERAIGLARRACALRDVRAVAFAFRAALLAAALRAILREAAVFFAAADVRRFAAARARPLGRRLAAGFRPEPRTAFRLAIAWSLLASPGAQGAGGQP